MTGQDSEAGKEHGGQWRAGKGRGALGAGGAHLQQGQQHQQGQGVRVHHEYPGDLQSLGLLGDQLHPVFEERTNQKPTWGL